MKQHLSFHYNFFKNIRNLFPDLVVDSDLKKLAFVWANIYLDVHHSPNVLFINANDLFLDSVVTLEKITNFFDMDPVKDLEPLNFYVKNDFLATEKALNNINPIEKIPFNVKEGYIKSNRFSSFFSGLI